MSSNNLLQLHNVFVYGSLLSNDVVHAPLNRVPQSSLAYLNNYHRFSIKGRVYPAILPLKNSKVNGRVLLGITDHERFILDEFEDVEYERSTVDVMLVDSCEMLKADTYVWSDKNDPNLYGEWDFEQWKKVHMDDFLKMTMSFMEELDLPESNSRVTTYETYYKKEDDNKPSLSS